jgi:hypothetical protein
MYYTVLTSTVMYGAPLVMSYFHCFEDNQHGVFTKELKAIAWEQFWMAISLLSGSGMALVMGLLGVKDRHCCGRVGGCGVEILGGRHRHDRFGTGQDGGG